MIPLEEMAAWSLQEIESAIRRSLPPRWQFNKTQNQGIFVVAFLNEEGAPVWEQERWDERLSLLDAFGWISLRGHEPLSEVWSRRRVDAPSRPASLRTQPLPPDPEDLVPSEIERVYRGPSTRR